MNRTAQQLFTILLAVLAGNMVFLIPAVCTQVMASERSQVGGQQSLTSVQSLIYEEPLSLKACLNKALKDNPLLSEAQLGVRAGEKTIDSA